MIKSTKYKKELNYEEEIKKLKKNLNLTKNQSIEFDKRIKYKSFYIYKNILEFIDIKKYSEFRKYDLMHSIFIYDKRLRKVLYEFISFVEEILRSNLLNKFQLSENEIKKIYSLDFSDLISELKINEFDLKWNHLEEIRKLRNNVFHNRLVLIDLKNKVINKSNKEAIIKLWYFLDKDIADDFIKKIKKIENKTISYKYKDRIKFKLPNELYVSKWFK